MKKESNNYIPQTMPDEQNRVTDKPPTMDIVSSKKVTVHSLYFTVHSLYKKFIVHTLYFIVFLLCFIVHSSAQTIDVGGLKNTFKAKPVKFSGGVAANSMFYTGNGGYGRAPFTWFLQGNLNASLFGKINLPFSFNLTNNGAGYNYPVMPNRLSLHPVYKWINGHIGDVAMSFSPYTLSGHQFRGVGIDLAPQGAWKVSAMYGRLQKHVSFDTINKNSQPAYERWGYGTKLDYEKEKYRLGVSAFYAKDKAGSPQPFLDSLMILPQQNVSVSYEGALKPLAGMELSVEYATTALTNDVRDSTGLKNKNYLAALIDGNGSTATYHALKGQLNYSYKKSTVGVGYERVDPGYKTLGAYYFNNDLENMTFNITQLFLKDKANMAVNFGLQKDNLKHTKTGTTNRIVGSANLNYTPSQKVQVAVMYSNFQTHMNIQPQFEYINNPYTQYQNLDTLNYVQIAQNASLNLNVNTKKSETQNQVLNVNISFQDASDEQSGVVKTGNGSQFYNLASSYGIAWPKTGMNATLGYNLSYNTIARNEMLTMGPTLSLANKWLDKKMTTTFTTSYNTSTTSGVKQNSILNLRLNAAYTIFKKHNLSLGIINQYRSALNRNNTNDLTGTLGYGYTF